MVKRDKGNIGRLAIVSPTISHYRHGPTAARTVKIVGFRGDARPGVPWVMVMRWSGEIDTICGSNLTYVDGEPRECKAHWDRVKATMRQRLAPMQEGRR